MEMEKLIEAQKKQTLSLFEHALLIKNLWVCVFLVAGYVLKSEWLYLVYVGVVLFLYRFFPPRVQEKDQVVLYFLLERARRLWKVLLKKLDRLVEAVMLW